MQLDKDPLVNFVVALPSEARALVDHYRLRAREPRGSFAVYARDEIHLIVSGVGKIGAAAATGYLHGLLRAKNQVWLNVGIGGHARRPVGAAILAHKICDRDTLRHYYPQFTFTPSCPTEEVWTVPRPILRFAEECPEAVCDMEASGFFQAAAQFSSNELVHAIKVISDNGQSSIHNIDGALAQQLVESHLALIESVKCELATRAAQLAERAADPPQLDDFLTRWHFTVSEQHQLRRLLGLHQTLTGRALSRDSFDRWGQAAEVLQAIARAVEALAIDRPFGAAG